MCFVLPPPFCEGVIASSSSSGEAELAEERRDLEEATRQGLRLSVQALRVKQEQAEQAEQDAAEQDGQVWDCAEQDALERAEWMQDELDAQIVLDDEWPEVYGDPAVSDPYARIDDEGAVGDEFPAHW
jgi:Rad3-related DNA helicase